MQEEQTTTSDDQTEESQTDESTDSTDDDEEVEVVEEKILVDEKVSSAIAEKVADIVAEKTVEAKIAADKAQTKKLGLPAVSKHSAFEKLGKEQIFAKQVLAGLRGDTALLKDLNAYNLDRRAKAGYQNEGTNADGGFLVPDADFEAEVLRLQEQYGAARQGGVRIRRVSSDSLKINKANSSVTMYATNEAAQKTGTKMTFDQKEVTLVKYAAIAAVTDELEEDAAVDIWNELTRDFAREKARIEDVRVFTHATSGLVHQAGLNIISVHASDFTDINFDDLSNAIYGVPTPSADRGAFFMNRYAWNVIRQLKVNAEAGNYALGQPGQDTRPTIWGRPVILTEVLDGSNGANKAFVVYGDLSNVTLIEKRGLVLDVLKEATVHDSDGNAVNLGEKDMKALRAVVRLNAVTVFPNAFSVLGTGTVS